MQNCAASSDIFCSSTTRLNICLTSSMWDLADTLLGSSSSCLMISSISTPNTSISLSASMSAELSDDDMCLAPGLTVMLSPDLILSTDLELVRGAGDSGLNSWAEIILSRNYQSYINVTINIPAASSRRSVYLLARLHSLVDKSGSIIIVAGNIISAISGSSSHHHLTLKTNKSFSYFNNILHNFPFVQECRFATFTKEFIPAPNNVSDSF